MFSRVFGTAAVCALAAQMCAAQEQSPSASFLFQGTQIDISRDGQFDPSRIAKFAQNASECGQNCLGPVQVAAGVKTLGEREVLAFMTQDVAAQTGLVVDARMPDARALGYIPGSASLPHATMHPDNGYQQDILKVLGATPTVGGLSFENARYLMVFDAGPASGDAQALIQHLLDAGYPADHLTYYRGGMLMWSALGFTTVEGAGS